MLRPFEANAWNEFLPAEPEFAGEEIAAWIPGPDPPDVLCTTMSSRIVGVELTMWVERGQLERSKARESIESNYLRVAASERETRPGNIGRVCVYDKPTRLRPKDEAQFRQELYDCVADQTALAYPSWRNPQGAPVSDFTRYPILGKFLESLWFYPRSRQRYLEPGGKWISFEGSSGGAYTPEWLVCAALDRIYAKVDAYEKRGLHGQHALDELHLICHYDDEALLYNTPIHAPGFGYADLATKVAQAVRRRHGVFDKMFLIHPWENPQVVQVYPSGDQGRC